MPRCPKCHHTFRVLPDEDDGQHDCPSCGYGHGSSENDLGEEEGLQQDEERQQEQDEEQAEQLELAIARAINILRLEELGVLDSSCRSCDEHYRHYREQWRPGGAGLFASSHLASKSCRSGRKPHCTCDTCF